MSDDEVGRPGSGNEDGSAVPAGWRAAPAATYGLEHPVVCPTCREEIHEIYVVRLYRTRVHFVSSLPRSGRLLVCPRCRAMVPGELGAVF